MNRVIDFLVECAARLGRWMFGTRNGWIFIGIAVFAIMLKSNPNFLVELITGFCTGILNLIARIIHANQKSLEYIFCIAFLIFAIRMMFKGVFNGGGKK